VSTVARARAARSRGAAEHLRPRISTALREQADELRAFREIATLQDVAVTAHRTA
jgi:hypothetical protein